MVEHPCIQSLVLSKERKVDRKDEREKKQGSLMSSLESPLLTLVEQLNSSHHLMLEKVYVCYIVSPKIFSIEVKVP